MSKKDCLEHKDMRNTQSKTKLIKTRKKIGRPSCLACYDCTDNFKSEEIKMTNRVLREKSNCVHLVNQDLKKKNTATKNNSATT